MHTFFVFLLGLCVGSFLNAWIHRIRTGTSVMIGRSHCPSCTHVLGWQDLVPVVSFIALRGRCRYCKGKIDWQYPLVELAAGLLFLLTYTMQSYHVSDSMYYELLIQWFFISVLIVIFVYDLRYMEIPDKVTLPAIVIGIILNFSLWFQVPTHQNLLTYLLINLFTPLLIGGGFFFLQFVVSRGRWIGGGDIRLGALMGVILGWPGILIGLCLAYVIGSFVAVALVASKRKTMQSQIAFGTFLSLATVITMLWGGKIVGLLGFYVI